MWTRGDTVSAAEQSFCIKHFNQTYNKVEKVLDKHYGFRVPVVETKEHTLFLRKYETLK
jgi:uncharacterized protein involved in tolerance to divalent cations